MLTDRVDIRAREDWPGRENPGSMSTSDWSAVQPLISTWSRRVRESQRAHYAAASQYSALNYWLGIPTVILSSAVGTGIFATLEKNVDVRVRIGIGLVSVLSATLAGLQTFLRFAERAEKHRIMAGHYAMVRREIEQLLVLPPTGGEELRTSLDSLRSRIDALAGEAPQIPQRSWNQVERMARETTQTTTSKIADARSGSVT